MTLEAELVDLADHLDVPAGDALPTRVAVAVRTGRRRASRRRLVVVLAVLVVLLLTISLVPAVGEWLGVRGVEVHQGPPPPTTGAPPAHSLDLGAASTLAAAGRRAGFDVVVPDSLGAPAGVWLDIRTGVPVVTLTYAGGRLVSELRTRGEDEVVLQKFASVAREIDVDGHRAVWVEGVHEIFDYRLRLSDSALLLEVGGITVRIETRFGLDDAVAIARNLVRAAGVDRP